VLEKSWLAKSKTDLKFQISNSIHSAREIWLRSSST